MFHKGRSCLELNPARGCGLSRRDFLRLSASIGMGAVAFGTIGTASSVFGDTQVFRNYMPQRMVYQELGNTGMMLSGVGFGGVTAEISEPYPDVYEQMLERALDLGVNFFDASATGEGYAKTEDYQNEENYAYLCQGIRAMMGQGGIISAPTPPVNGWSI